MMAMGNTSERHSLLLCVQGLRFRGIVIEGFPEKRFICKGQYERRVHPVWYK